MNQLIKTYFRARNKIEQWDEYTDDEINYVLKTNIIPLNDLLVKVPHIISDIENIPYETLLHVVKKRPFSIFYIENPSEELQLIAVQSNPDTLEGIKNPTENVMITAMRKDLAAYHLIANPTEKVKRFYLSSGGRTSTY